MAPDDDPLGDVEHDPGTIRELRHSYHDRIADLRTTTGEIVSQAEQIVVGATEALLAQDPTTGDRVAAAADQSTRLVGTVDAEVLALLALQAPVARDLRVILAARDIAVVATLCIGLGRTLATRVGSAKKFMSPEIRALIDRMGTESAELLRQAHGAWQTLDDGQARAVVAGVGESRTAQSDFFTALVQLEDVPVEAAVDLGIAVRAYSRLTDHAAEIASSVIFAVTGTPAVQAYELAP